MGGVGSGRYFRWGNATTIEAVKRIDIRYMRRKRLLKPGYGGSLSWTRNSEPCGDIRYSCWADRLTLDYRFRSSDADWEPVQQIVFFDRTPCRYGGERLWFLCPICRRRCEVLCFAGKLAACRKCYQLPYQSQCEGPVDRLFTRRNALEVALWSNDRKKYRGAKREKMVAEWERLTELCDDFICERLLLD